MLKNAVKHKEHIQQYIAERTREAGRNATQMLSLYADDFTLKSIKEWFNVSMRRVKNARLHTRIFGAGTLIPESCKSGPLHSFRVPCRQAFALP